MTRGRGRPRSVEADRAIAAAALELLADGGFHALRMERVAEQARVGKTTVYRRWPTKEHLVGSIVGGVVEEMPVPDTGSVRGDLLEALTYQLALLAAGLGRVSVGLAAESLFNPSLAERLREPTLRRRTTLEQVILRGIERGELRADVDPQRAVDLVWGPVFYRFAISGVMESAPDEAFVEAVVDDALRGLRAPAA